MLIDFILSFDSLRLVYLTLISLVCMLAWLLGGPNNPSKSLSDSTTKTHELLQRLSLADERWLAA